MRAYRKEIPGKAHLLDEDRGFDTNFTDSQGNSYGIYIVGDGLSGSAGDFASNYAVNTLGRYLQETFSRGMDEKNIPVDENNINKIISAKIEVIHQKLFTGRIHEKLEKKGKTTLDSVVIRNEQSYIHHLGDSRVYFVHADGKVEQVTRDDSQITSDLGPSNSVGGEGRIREYPRTLGGVKYIFLTTDGLESRATDEQVQTLLRTLTSYNAPFLLDSLAQIIERPREKLNKFQNKFLHEILKGKAQPSREESEDNEKLVELIFSFYGKDKEVTERVDAKLKHDDTTMILVDIEDKVSAILSGHHDYERLWKECAEVKHLHRESLATYRQMQEGLASVRAELHSWDLRQNKIAQEAAEQEKRLQQRVAEVERQAAEHKARLRQELQTQHSGLQGQYRDLQDRYQDLHRQYASLQHDFEAYKSQPWWRRIRKGDINKKIV